MLQAIIPADGTNNQGSLSMARSDDAPMLNAEVRLPVRTVEDFSDKGPLLQKQQADYTVGNTTAPSSGHACSQQGLARERMMALMTNEYPQGGSQIESYPPLMIKQAQVPQQVFMSQPTFYQPLLVTKPQMASQQTLITFQPQFLEPTAPIPKAALQNPHQLHHLSASLLEPANPMHQRLMTNRLALQNTYQIAPSGPKKASNHPYFIAQQPKSKRALASLFMFPHVVDNLGNDISCFEMLATLCWLLGGITSLIEFMSKEQDCGIQKLYKQLKGFQAQAPIELKAQTLAQILGKHVSPAGYFQSVLNLLDKSRNPAALRQLFQAHLSITEICIDCGRRIVRSETASMLTLTNETEIHQFAATVRLQVIYIFDYGQAKKYELVLHPGEYSYQEVIGMIKEKISYDRVQVKLSKRIFCLVDLFQGLVFGQMFNDERMKFKFTDHQVLTTYAYEINKSMKRLVHRNMFIHVAEVDSQGAVLYHSFPRLVHYQEIDPLKSIAFKIYRAMRSLLPGAVEEEDPMAELNAYNSLFSTGNAANEPYEMVIVLQDGSRWKLDPNKTQKLCSLINAEQITRFECIFKASAAPLFEATKKSFQEEMACDTVNMVEQGLKSMEHAVPAFFAPQVLQPIQQVDVCAGCGLKAGLQRQVKATKLGQYIVMEVKKLHVDNVFTIQERLNLERFVQSPCHRDHMAPVAYYTNQNLGQPLSQRQPNSFELVGAILQAGFRKPIKNEVAVIKQEEVPSKTVFVQPVLLQAQGADEGKRYLVHSLQVSDGEIKQAQEVSQTGTPAAYKELMERLRCETRLLVYRRQRKA